MAKNRVDIVFILASILIIVLRICYIHKDDCLIFDDSYMQLRYADHIVHGGGYSWNYGVPSYGCTSILYIFYLILCKSFLGIFGINNEVVVMQTASSIMYSIFVLFIYRIKTIILKNNYLYSIIVFILCLSSLLFYNTYNAIETMASLVALTGLAYYSAKIMANTSVLDFSHFAKIILFGILAFSIRHDNGIYALLIPTFTFIHLKNKKYILLFIAIFSIFLATDTLFKYWYFGDPLPLTFYIKQGNYYKGYMSHHLWSPFLYLAAFIRNFFWLPAIIALLYFKPKGTSKSLIFLFPLILTICYYFSVTQIMGNDARFYIPSTGILLTGMMMITRNDFSLDIKPTLTKAKIMLLMLLISMPFLLEIIHYKIYYPYRENLSHQESIEFRKLINYPLHLKSKKYAWQPLVMKMDTLVSIMDDKGVFAATEYGYLGYKHPKMVIMDLAGLHNIEIAKHGFSDKQLESYKPDLIWMPHFYYTGLYYSVMYSQYFRDNYFFYPYVYNYGVAVHKESRFKEKLIEEIKKQP